MLGPSLFLTSTLPGITAAIRAIRMQHNRGLAALTLVSLVVHAAVTYFYLIQ